MMKLITEELLDTVTSQAKENSRLRMNYNFHASMDAPIHRLLNALEPGTYLPPVNMVWKFLLIHGIVLLPWSQVPLFLKLKKAHISLYPQRIWLRGLLRLLIRKE